MEKVIEFFTYLLTNHGIWGLLGFLLLLSVPLLFVFLIVVAWSATGKALDDKLAKQIALEKKRHKIGNELRKKFTVEVKDLLWDLAQRTKADRALVFEYSNGSSNLVGLPFLFASAAAEVTTPGTTPVSENYQRINLSILSNFILQLEEEQYIYFDNIENIKTVYPALYTMMIQNNAHSGLFYVIQGVDEVVGFVALTTIGNKVLDKKCAMSDISRVAQKISAMWNYEEIKELVHKKEKWWKIW